MLSCISNVFGSTITKDQKVFALPQLHSASIPDMRCHSRIPGIQRRVGGRQFPQNTALGLVKMPGFADRHCLRVMQRLHAAVPVNGGNHSFHLQVWQTHAPPMFAGPVRVDCAKFVRRSS